VTAHLGLAVFVAALLAQRVAELVISARHARTLAPLGPREFGRAHFPMFVALHTLYPVALVLEVLRWATRPPAAWPVWLAVWLAAQALRIWAIRSLGDYWNVRIRVVPGVRPIHAGPYRLLSHPNYIAVALEFVAGPLLFGAWRTALVFSALNAIAMSIRIPIENEALRWAAAEPPTDVEIAAADRTAS
jgi:methyltransferase